VICVRRRWCLLAALGATVLLRPPPLEAATAAEMARAREQFAAARIHYDLKEYDLALQGFKDAYRSVQDPVFLFNIGQCHWKLGHEREAVDFYRNYLRRAPGAPNRPEVERRVQELEAAIKLRVPAVPAPAAPAPSADPEPGPVAALPPLALAARRPPLAPAARPPPPVLVAQPTAPPPRRFYRTWWFWAGVSVLAVSASAVVLGVAGRGQVGDCMGIQPCRDLGR
jgi:tetratricopeptide (TPR) repeat protein